VPRYQFDCSTQYENWRLDAGAFPIDALGNNLGELHHCARGRIKTELRTKTGRAKAEPRPAQSATVARSGAAAAAVAAVAAAVWPASQAMFNSSLQQRQPEITETPIRIVAACIPQCVPSVTTTPVVLRCAVPCRHMAGGAMGQHQ
jgi:hypothetical protein